MFEENGGDDETRTRDLCRDSVAWIGFTTTYNTAGTAKVPRSRTRPHELWVGLWVGKSAALGFLLLLDCSIVSEYDRWNVGKLGNDIALFHNDIAVIFSSHH